MRNAEKVPPEFLQFTPEFKENLLLLL